MAARALLRPVELTEAQTLRHVLRALAHCPQVAWYARMNAGAGRLQYRDGGHSQFMRFGFVGCPDVIGQLKDGRFLGVEVKRPSGQVRPEQAAMLAKINTAGGLAFVARSAADVFDAIVGANG